jgi:hypothetical protein
MVIEFIYAALAIIAAGVVGALLEGGAPRTQFPKSWTPSRAEPLASYPWYERIAAGALFGAIFLAWGCGFASCEFFSLSAAPSFTIAMVVKAMVAGLIGARMVRMGISVPLSAAWTFFCTVVDTARGRSGAAVLDTAAQTKRKKAAKGKTMRRPIA